MVLASLPHMVQKVSVESGNLDSRSFLEPLSDLDADILIMSQLKVTYEVVFSHLRLALLNCGEWATGHLEHKHVTSEGSSAHCHIK